MGRKDGKKIKGVDGFTRMGALIINKDRTGCTNFYTQEIPTKSLDEYIAKKKTEGVDYTYRDIAIATLVRLFHIRPQLNRFVMKGNFYQRNYIDVSMVMHKDLRTGAQETGIKCRFTGKETLEQVKQKLDAEIHKAIFGSNNTDAFTGGFLGKMPTWMIRMLLGVMRWADRWGLLSDKFMFSTSPMHASIVFVDLKSVHLGPVWHHMYNFGNCGFICTMGKEKARAVVDPKTGALKAENVMELGISQDERFIDGLRYSHMIKAMTRIVENMEVLERAPEDDEIKLPPPTAREKKKKAKLAKKEAKRKHPVTA